MLIDLRLIEPTEEATQMMSISVFSKKGHWQESLLITSSALDKNICQVSIAQNQPKDFQNARVEGLATLSVCRAAGNGFHFVIPCILIGCAVNGAQTADRSAPRSIRALNLGFYVPFTPVIEFDSVSGNSGK
ncbi:hypothetical protein A2154_05140 [Candidatus Gottesmanbacteria bacterium RBG_16_43_7]|uniref:Uncharacterized protein n=1 Tax=Candidatus Gottesmanbacteria bacterium RBG_16_43_7 TaxID=1798373 RepID=A0A1F5ZBY5_9BACT|nr:MAG: hypothetical protein A2154_05140 [Candidatus Gottesmanbacteria bacterium RBG_16_43_7]